MHERLHHQPDLLRRAEAAAPFTPGDDLDPFRRHGASIDAGTRACHSSHRRHTAAMAFLSTRNTPTQEGPQSIAYVRAVPAAKPYPLSAEGAFGPIRLQ